ncbi:MAG: YhbY family RNA-binding protein [Promethearchaeota archaeon]
MKGKSSNKEKTINIGKNGLSHNFFDYLKRQVDKDGVVKVRVLKNAVSASFGVKEYAKEIARELNVKVHDFRGNTFMVRKP